MARATSPGSPRTVARLGTLDEVPPFKDPIHFSRKDVTPKVEPFPMTQVRLLPGPFLEAAEWNRGYMEWAQRVRIRRYSDPVVIQIYSEVLQKFRLAARGKGDGRKPPAQTSMSLGGKIFQEQSVHRAFETDMKF